MKIEQLLVQHFYIAKQVTLQGIGTFTLSPDFIAPADSDKEIVLPENSVSFQYNPKATEDGALIDYIVQQTRKIRPLATADLESYLMLASQFLNIGKPLKIEGIGVLEKGQDGVYRFYQGEYVNTKVETAEVKLKEKAEEDISFSNESTSSSNNKKMLLVFAGIVGIALIAWAAWHFLNKEKTPVAENAIEQPATPAPDTAKKDTIAPVQQKPDSIKPAVPAENSNYTFKVVIKNYPALLPAQNSYKRLTSYGHKLLLYTADSVTFKVAMPLNTPLSDTARARDSVRILFGGKPYIEQ
ncbi:hypothetical protein [Ferruginibacter sp.]